MASFECTLVFEEATPEGTLGRLDTRQLQSNNKLAFGVLQMGGGLAKELSLIVAIPGSLEIEAF